MAQLTGQQCDKQFMLVTGAVPLIDVNKSIHDVSAEYLLSQKAIILIILL